MVRGLGGSLGAKGDNNDPDVRGGMWTLHDIYEFTATEGKWIRETGLAVSKGGFSIDPGTDLIGSATVSNASGSVSVQHQWEVDGTIDPTATTDTFSAGADTEIRYRQVVTDSVATVYGDWSDIISVRDVIEFNLQFLVIAGGGQHSGVFSSGGGGAGGYISSIAGESSGGGTLAIPGVNLTTLAGNAYSISVGAAGSNSVFSGTDISSASFNHTAIAGGGGSATAASTGLTGGSGGGGTGSAGAGGSGTTSQGFAGSAASTYGYPCDRAWAICNAQYPQCSTARHGAGGGAGGAANLDDGGDGVQSSVTGTATYYAGGGAARAFGVYAGCAYPVGTPGLGQSNYGGGGNYGSLGQDGVVILRYPTTVSITNPLGGLTMSTSVVGDKNVTVITAGFGDIEFDLA